MRVALRGQIKFKLIPENLSAEQRLELSKMTEPIYAWVEQKQPQFKQDGRNYSYLVAPFRVMQDFELLQSGAGVLCETETEKKETFDNLVARNKQHLVSFLSGRVGGVGWTTNFRRVANEIKPMFRNLPSGKILWAAIEREIDLDTLEVSIIRKKETDSEGEANYWAGKWLEEYNKKKKAYFDSVSTIVTPPPPPHCTALTQTEIKDIGKAKMKAIERQWPHCFKIFENQKQNQIISDDEIQKAYLLDLAANGIDPFAGNSTCEKFKPDMEFISALHNTARNYARRGKSKVIDAALYMIAFNWEFGWCYFSHDELAEKISEFLEISFTASQAKNYLETLGLYTKHKPGLPPKV
jgi:hypothetical protein